MAFLEWTAKLETGIESIDFQHQQLVNMINNLAQALSDPPGPGQDLIISVTLEQLINYTHMHFGHEESLMEKADYEHIKSHILAHKELKEKVQDFAARLKRGEPDLGQPILEFLKSWLINHIMKIDFQYVPSMVKARIE